MKEAPPPPSDNSQQGRSRIEPNPYRSPGDAMKRWMERLHVIDEEAPEKQSEQKDHMDVTEQEVEQEAENDKVCSSLTFIISRLISYHIHAGLSIYERR